MGLTLFESQKLGLVKEVDLYAAMAFCYAGHTLAELTAYAEVVLLRRDISRRIRTELLTVLAWARQRNINCYVVSASPTPIVAWAASHWGFAPDHVIGTMPKTRDGLILSEISEVVPFGASKCELLTRRTGNLRCLAAFGDSEFNFEMLQNSDIAVAVAPKPELLSRLLHLNHAVVLRIESESEMTRSVCGGNKL